GWAGLRSGRRLLVENDSGRATLWQRRRRASLPGLLSARESTSLSYLPCHLVSRQGLPVADTSGGSATKVASALRQDYNPKQRGRYSMSQIAEKIKPSDHGRRMSLADFEHAETVEGRLYELGRGVIIVSEVPNPPHLAQVTAI